MDSELREAEERVLQEQKRKLECSVCTAYVTVRHDAMKHDPQAWSNLTEESKKHERRAHPEFVETTEAVTARNKAGSDDV